MSHAGPLFDALHHLAIRLGEYGAPWALVGGLAVSVRVEPRFTRDVDVVVAVRDDQAAEQLVADLVAGGFSLFLTLEQAALGRLAAVRLVPPGGTQASVVVDLLFSSSGIEADICRDAEWLEVLPDVTVPVARAGHLAAMKLLSRRSDRPQDDIDLHSLVAGLTDDERERFRLAVRRIEALGANRGKALSAELAELLDG